MSSTSTHPSEAQLIDFLDGRLPIDEQTIIEQHVAACESCTSKMDVTRIRSESKPDSLDFSVDPPASDHTQVWSDSTTEVAGPPIPHGLLHHSRYRLLRPIGAGGMGTVWLAEHSVLGRNVALKVIRPEYVAKPGAVVRFRRESRAVAKLQHANIVAAYDAEEAEGTHFLVMEYVEGVNLADLVKANGPLPVEEAVRAGVETALGLAAAHAAGMIHRDIKPHNLIRTVNGRTKILDFGLATAEAGSGELTGENVVMGTPDYIAPEQALDAHSADARSDIYSLGCSLYFLLTGQVPYPVVGTLKKLDAHRAGRAMPVHERNPEVPETLSRTVATMMAKRPENRPQTAMEVAEALRDWNTHRRPGFRWKLAAVPAAGLVIVLAVILATRSAKPGNGVTVGEVVPAPSIPETTEPNRPGIPTNVVLTEARSFKHYGNVFHLDYSADGSALAINGTTPAIIDPRTATISKSFIWEKVRRTALNPAGSLLAVWIDDLDGSSYVQTWDVATARQIDKYGPFRRDSSWFLKFTPGGEHLLIGQDEALHRATLNSDKLELLVAAPQWTEMRFAEFSLDGKRIAIPDASFDRLGKRETVIRILEYPSARETERIMLPGVPQNDLHMLKWASGDEAVVCTLRSGELRGYSRAGKQQLFRVQGHVSAANLAMFPDGKRFASVSSDGWLRVWDAETGRKLGEAKDAPMFGIAISPDNKTIATGSTAGKVVFWDCTTPIHSDIP